jgi:hypothetical protein
VRLRVVLAVFLALAALAALGIWLGVRSLSGGLPIELPVQQCVVNAADGGKAILEPEQMANAATITAVGIKRGVPDHAVTIALATALQESKLQNLQGGDRDSLGLFQQRPSQDWGTPEQIMDPHYSAAQFYKALLKIKGWQDMTVAQAAQAVQRSADGSLYARWEDRARVLAAALTGEETGAVGCTITDSPSQRGSAAVSALANELAADWGTGHASTTNGKVTVTVPNSRTGWQYAHWLVSYAAFQGIQQVRYGDQVWTSKSSKWTTVTAAPAQGQVIAEVFP